jgi:aminopeptidase YwaD
LASRIKKIGAVVLILVFVLLGCGSYQGFNPQTYSVDRIKNTIDKLSSKEFNGRMAGTKYGRITEEYVEARFKEAGLKPGGVKGTYFQEFPGISGNPSGEYILEIYDGKDMVKTYKYAKDYKSFAYFSHSGEVSAGAVKLDSLTGNIPKGDGKLALVQGFNNAILNRESKILSDLYGAGYRGLIVRVGSTLSRKKGQFGYEDKSEASKMPRVCVTGNVFDELLDYAGRGFRIHLKSAYDVKNFTARNVIGIIRPKKPSDKYLIISAHMDHLGVDPDGVYFPGALDNASGVSCMIEIANAVMSQKQKPDINVVFIAFSGEEEMLYGSSYYVRNPIYPLDDTRVINLDMVGAKKSMPLSILKTGTGHRGSSEADIFERFEDNAKHLNLEYELTSGGASDHAPFADAGVPAVTLIDYEKVVYHVPEDTMDNIGTHNLKRAMDLTMAVVGEEIYIEDKVAGMPHAYIYIIVVIIIAASGFIIYRRYCLKKVR